MGRRMGESGRIEIVLQVGTYTVCNGARLLIVGVRVAETSVVLRKRLQEFALEF